MTLGRFLSQTLRILVLAAIVLFASHGLASAQSRSSRFGLGGMVGEPTGLSMKLRLSPAFAIDFGVGFGGFGPGYGQVHADFLGAVNLTEHSRAGMDIYFGGGPRLAFADHGGGENVRLSLRRPTRAAADSGSIVRSLRSLYFLPLLLSFSVGRPTQPQRAPQDEGASEPRRRCAMPSFRFLATPSVDPPPSESP